VRVWHHGLKIALFNGTNHEKWHFACGNRGQSSDLWNSEPWMSHVPYQTTVMNIGSETINSLQNAVSLFFHVFVCGSAATFYVSFLRVSCFTPFLYSHFFWDVSCEIRTHTYVYTHTHLYVCVRNTHICIYVCTYVYRSV